ncbi:MAG: class I SAM-dependent methyltransferase [Flavobacteriaceae bacterium]|nr:class I SAM-dependent methyltransferase [Flavobacteriaceae bacterium]
MSKAKVKRLLRRFGLMRLSDNLRYQIMKIQNRKDNQNFRKEHPDVVIPPDYILYEAHQLKYRSYYNYGLSNAKRLITLFETYTDLSEKKILDWGCGPARIIRHFPELLKNSICYGTDYNTDTIAWNQEHIKGVTFHTNGIFPPTVYEDEFFDAIYGLSVLTHLSEENHFNWINELYRIAKTGAILILTTHGKAFREKLVKDDQLLFDTNNLVVQGNTLEGHRTFAAFHPPKYMLKLFAGKFAVLDLIEGTFTNGNIAQDKWILKKI